jgi:hypothetical protein
MINNRNSISFYDKSQEDAKIKKATCDSRSI